MKRGDTFKLNATGYGLKETLTVTKKDKDGITCSTSRFPGVIHRIPNAALAVYESKGQIVRPPTKADYRHALRMAEQSLSNTAMGEAVRYEEVIELGDSAEIVTA